MQQNSFFRGCNYVNRGSTDARTGWSMCPVQDIDTVSTHRYGVNVNVDDTLSLFYCDLYLRHLKETLKHTMLVHESVFESQIYELHRLYRRQKELMMEMEGTRHREALYLNSSLPSPRAHWMSSSISTYQTRSSPYEENIPCQVEAVDNANKSEKKVMDSELPIFGCLDREEESSLMNSEVHEVANFLESGNQSNKLQLDLNEPAKIEEHSDYVFNQFLSPVTSKGTGEESDKKNEGEDSAKGSNLMNEAQGQPFRGGYGIDLNMSPFSFEEEVNIFKESETEKPPECLSVSLQGKHISEQSRVVVQALPCLSSTLLSSKPHKSLMISSRPRKKVKLGPVNKTFKGSELEKGSSSSLSEVKSARNRTNLGKKRRCKPQRKSSNGQKVIAKKKQRKKSRRISLVTEGNYQEVSAAEAIVDMSRKSGREASDFITSLGRNLLLLSEISSSAVEDYELDHLEGMALTDTKLEDHKKTLRSNSADNKTAVSNIVIGKQRRSRARQGKLKRKDDRRGDGLSLGTFSECEADEVIRKLIEASESKWDCGFPEKKSKSSPTKLRDGFISLEEEKTLVDWGAVKKRRRGSRIHVV